MKPFPLLSRLLILAIFSATILAGCEYFNPPKEEPAEEVPDGVVSAQGFETPRMNILQDGVDTLTNADTLDLSLGYFYGPIVYQIQLSADSVSGSTAGNLYLELDSDGDGVGFYRIETMVVNGVTTRSIETGTILGGALRLRYIQGGTQVNRIWQEFLYCPRAPTTG